MRTQILYIHGGTAFSSYENFLANLRTRTIWDPSGIAPQRRWKECLVTEYGQTCDIFFPSMPNSHNAKYTEWKIWFERYFSYLTNDVILIGHSLGGYFLAKYLSENTPPFHVKALYLVASPFENANFEGEDGGDFAFNPKNLPKMQGVAENIIIFHAKDDSVVPYSHANSFHTALPRAEYILLETGGHFIGETFAELIEHVRTMIAR